VALTWRREACRAKRRREEEEASTSAHGTETIGWLAIDGGQGTWNGHAFPTPQRYGTPFRSEAVQTGNAVTHDWYALSFGGSYAAAPRFVASMAAPMICPVSSLNRPLSRTSLLGCSGVSVRHAANP